MQSNSSVHGYAPMIYLYETWANALTDNNIDGYKCNNRVNGLTTAYCHSESIPVQ